MKLPSDIQFHEDIRLLVWRPRGLLNQAAVNKIINFEYIIRVSLYRRHVYAGRPPVKSVILATDSTLIHYGKVHAVLTQGSPINVRVFQDRKEAAKWLNVPIERLTPNSARSETGGLKQSNGSKQS